MTLQKRLLHAMLALLGLAALVGISTIFLPNGEFIGRVAGTLLCAAFSIAVAIPFSKKVGIQAERTGALLALLAIVIAFCLAFASIWIDFLIPSSTWHLPLTTVAYCVCVIPALFSLSIYKRSEGRICGGGGLFFSAGVFISWLCAIWIEKFGATSHAEHFFQTTGLLAGSAIPICCCLFGELKDRHWRWLGVLTGIAAIGMGLAGIWMNLGGKPTNIIHCLIVSTVIGGSNILTRLRLPDGQRWLALATAVMLCISGLSGLFVNEVIDGDPNVRFDDISVRILTASAIVTVCGILALVVLKAFNRRVVITESRNIADIKQISLTCPRCAKKQEAAMGESRCSGCGLIFLLKVAEPHCTKCNYMLLDIRAARCPECGEPIQTS